MTKPLPDWVEKIREVKAFGGRTEMNALAYVYYCDGFNDAARLFLEREEKAFQIIEMQREVLRFYGEMSNWKKDHNFNDIFKAEPVSEDVNVVRIGGHIARQALEKTAAMMKELRGDG